MQIEAIKNQVINENINKVGDAETLVGFGTTLAGATGVIPEPTSKLATAFGLVLAGVGVATQFVELETDPNKIVKKSNSNTTETFDQSGYVIKPPSIK